MRECRIFNADAKKYAQKKVMRNNTFFRYRYATVFPSKVYKIIREFKNSKVIIREFKTFEVYKIIREFKNSKVIIREFKNFEVYKIIREFKND
jgi:hypothetical protein